MRDVVDELDESSRPQASRYKKSLPVRRGDPSKICSAPGARGFSVVQSEESSWRSGCGWFGGGSEPWVAILAIGVR